MNIEFWRKCSVCKSEIDYNKTYYVCSVSSCNKKRSPTQFCSVSCWDAHNAVLNHMSAGADEERSPSKSDIQNSESPPRRKIIVKPKKESNSNNHDEILVVVSKLKAYINETSGLNTSADVMPELSNLIRTQCDKAIERARISGRKTVMARDFD